MLFASVFSSYKARAWDYYGKAVPGGVTCCIFDMSIVKPVLNSGGYGRDVYMVLNPY